MNLGVNRLLTGEAKFNPMGEPSCRPGRLTTTFANEGGGAANPARPDSGGRTVKLDSDASFADVGAATAPKTSGVIRKGNRWAQRDGAV